MLFTIWCYPKGLPNLLKNAPNTRTHRRVHVCAFTYIILLFLLGELSIFTQIDPPHFLSAVL